MSKLSRFRSRVDVSLSPASGGQHSRPGRREFIRDFLLTVVLAVGVGAGLAGCGSTTNTTPTTTGPFTVTGTLAPTSGSGANIAVSLTGTGGTFNVQSNSTGGFSISNVPSGTYTLTAAGFNPVTVTIGSSNTGALGSISLTPTSQTQGNFTVTGTLTPTSGSAASIPVSLVSSSTTLTGQTSSSGAFSISNVPAGAYTLTPTGFNGVTVTVGSSNSGALGNISVTPSTQTQGSFTVTGTLMLSSGSAAGIPISLAGSGGLFNGQTNSGGMFTIASVPAGSYTLSGTGFNPVTVVVSSANSGSLGTISASPQTTFTVTGTLVPTSGSAANMIVRLLVPGTTGGQVAFSGQTDANGVFMIPGVPSGSYVLSGGFNPVTVIVNATNNGVLGSITVTPPTPTTFMLVGQVVDATTGMPIPVTITGLPGGSITSANGMLHVSNLPNGTYNVTFSSAMHNDLTVTVMVNSTDVDLGNLGLPASTTTRSRSVHGR